MLKIKIVTHYDIDDPEFQGEYREIEIFINDRLIQTYGDWSHDNGDEKAEGFMDGIKAATDDFEVEYLDSADYEA